MRRVTIPGDFNTYNTTQLNNFLLSLNVPRNQIPRFKAQKITLIRQIMEQGVTPAIYPQRVISPPRAKTHPLSPIQLSDAQLNGNIRLKLQNETFETYDFPWQRLTYGDATPLLVMDMIAKINRHTRSYTHGDIIGYIMREQSHQELINLMAGLNFNRYNDTIPGFLNFLWYYHGSHDRIDLTDHEEEYLSGLSEAELINLLGPRYRGPQDKASLLFAAVSGKSAHRPSITDIPRYQSVMTYDMKTAWLIAEKLYGIINSEDEFISVYPPYVHIALHVSSPIETILAKVTPQNVENFINAYGIVLHPEEQTTKYDYFIQEIVKYKNVFTRPANIPPPPILTDKTDDQIKNILQEYTLKEIVNTYEPNEFWNTREELIRRILKDKRKGSVWSWRHRYCNNDDTFNVVEALPHGEMNKEDNDDPTLSYGVQRNYRCYQTSELSSFWDFDADGIFRFIVPDWREQTPPLIDPTTNTALISEFPLQSIRQLRLLLNNPPPGYNITNLLAKVDEGINAANAITLVMQRLKREYMSKSQQEQSVIQLYLAWLFTYGMWMRFWKGPGYPWASEWMEGGGGTNYCDQGRRDEHVFIQGGVKTTIIETYERYPGLKEWIEALPLINYDFRSGEAKLAIQGITTIKGILDKIQLGDFCLAHGSDLILKSSYYFIDNILNRNTIPLFNAFLNSMIPQLNTIELQIVRRELTRIPNTQRNRTKIDILQNRLGELTRPIPLPQPDFVYTDVGITGHIDPWAGEINFD
jgi:hypothetical protein